MRRAIVALAASVLLATAASAFALRAPGPAPAALAGVEPAAAQVLAPALAEQLATADPGAPAMVFVHSATIDKAVSAVDAAGLQLVSRWAPIGVAVAVGTPDAIRRVAADPSVSYVEPDAPVELFLDTAHVATRAEDARGSALELLDAQGNAFDGSGVTIAINDGGVDGNHEMLGQDGVSKVVRNMRQACADPTVCNEWVDLDDSDQAGGHGTHVAGIAGGYGRVTADGREVRGAAPGAKLVGLGSGVGLSLYGVASGLQWVLENHADPCGQGSCPPIKVVNNSWGTTGGKFNPNAAASKFSTELVAAGVVVVFAAGNGDTTGAGGDGSTNSVNPYAQNPTPGVISVANYDDAASGSRDNALNSSSSRGLKTDPTTYPDMSAPGTDITSACSYTLPICRSSGDVADPNYAAISGTSMAAPYIAGVAALLLDANPLLTPAQIEEALEDTAYKFGEAVSYVADPANADNTTSFDKGHGLVDVAAALGSVLRRTVPAGVTCGGSAFVDRQGDATDVAVATGLPSATSEKALDITGASVSTDPATGALTFSVDLNDLGDLPPTGAAGEYIRFYFTFAGVPYFVGMERVGGSAQAVLNFTVQENVLNGAVVAGGLVGSFNVDTDTVSAVVPANAFKVWKPALPVVVSGDSLSGLEILSQRRLGVLTLSADTAKGACPYTVGS